MTGEGIRKFGTRKRVLTLSPSPAPIGANRPFHADGVPEINAKSFLIDEIRKLDIAMNSH
jgi:hypothetical protein